MGINLSYAPNIPNQPNDPADDQPFMQTNSQSIGTWTTIDHYGFNDNNGGLHKQVTMPLRGGPPGSIPPGLVANEGTAYVKNVNGVSQLFYTADASSNEVQMTRINSADFSTFGKNVFNTGNNDASGWTFLPGNGGNGGVGVLNGMLLNYGVTSDLNPRVGSTPGYTTITFPRAFTNPPFSITLTMLRDSQNVDVVYVRPPRATYVTATDFVVVLTTTGVNKAYYMAIGV